MAKPDKTKNKRSFFGACLTKGAFLFPKTIVHAIQSTTTVRKLVAKLEGSFSIPILVRIKDASTNDIVAEIEDHVDYYNNWRPQAGLGKMTPVEFREYLLAKPVGLPVPLAAARENGNPSLGIPVSQ